MSKKKKDPGLICQLDEKLDEKYVHLLQEIQFMQADIDRAEKKARKKALRQMKKGNTFYDVRIEERARQEVIAKMEGTDFFTRVLNVIEELKPVCVIIARLVMALIVSILSISQIQYRIRPETIRKMQQIYGVAKSVSVSI